MKNIDILLGFGLLFLLFNTFSNSNAEIRNLEQQLLQQQIRHDSFRDGVIYGK